MSSTYVCNKRVCTKHYFSIGFNIKQTEKFILGFDKTYPQKRVFPSTNRVIVIRGRSHTKAVVRKLSAQRKTFCQLKKKRNEK